MILWIAYPIAATIVGYLAWSGPEWVGLTAILPALWVRAEGRMHAGVIALAYYLIGARSIPESSAIFFGPNVNYEAGLAIWFMAGLLNAILWALAWSRNSAWQSIALRMGLVVLAITFPPLGLVGGLNPWIGAASLFPGAGWWAVIAGAAILIGMAIAGKTNPTIAVLASVGLLISQITMTNITPTGTVPQWVAHETEWGESPPDGTHQSFDRWAKIATTAENSFKEGATVVVLPEQIAGTWSDSAEIFLRNYLTNYLDSGKILVVGTAIHEHGISLNAAAIMSGEDTSFYYARQTIPVSMWRPWAVQHYPADWMAPATVTIDGKRVAISICYEDVLFGIGLLSFLHDKPQIILSMANAWWAEQSNQIEVQRLHINTLAKIFGVPIVRALNKPDSRTK